MLSTFEQVKEWITENGFKRWVLYKDYSKTEKIIDSANFTVSDMPDKLAMTEKYLRLAGGHAYAAGATSNATSDLNTTCEIRLSEAATQQSVQGIGGYPSIGELTETITKQVRAEIEAENYKRERADFEREKKEFEQEKQSALGALVHYLAPVAQQLLTRGAMPRVAGMDSKEDVHVIVPEDQPSEEQEEVSPFTDEEADELFALLARFKKVEPDYLTMLRKVVEMAESGDKTYAMAKNFLV